MYSTLPGVFNTEIGNQSNKGVDVSRLKMIDSSRTNWRALRNVKYKNGEMEEKKQTNKHSTGMYGQIYSLPSSLQHHDHWTIFWQMTHKQAVIPI